MLATIAYPLLMSSTMSRHNRSRLAFVGGSFGISFVSSQPVPMCWLSTRVTWPIQSVPLVVVGSCWASVAWLGGLLFLAEIAIRVAAGPHQYPVCWTWY